MAVDFEQGRSQDIRQAIIANDELVNGPREKPVLDAAALKRADRVAEGTVTFVGRSVGIGLSNINWAGRHVNHQEWPAQLNRFGYLSSLVNAYLASGDERYATSARSYIEDWIRAHPNYDAARAPLPGDRTLDMAIRLRAWLRAVPALASSPSFDDDFLQDIVSSVSDQARFLSRHLSAWGNWRLTELDALVFTDLQLPFLDSSQHLLQLGANGLQNELSTQFLPDGAHIERTPHYHSFLAWSLLRYYDLSQRHPELGLSLDPAKIVRAFDYTAHSDLSGFNDSPSPFSDPEVLEGLRARASVVARLAPEQAAAGDPPLEQVFPDAGQIFARSAWSPGADYLAFDAGKWGGTHSYLSRLSFVFRSGGHSLLCDPGILSYEMSDPLAVYGRSTVAHNTLTLNGCNQSEADAQLLRADFRDPVAFIHAKYEGGYWDGVYHWGFPQGHGPGDFGLHERLLLWVKGEYLLCLDTMEADPALTDAPFLWLRLDRRGVPQQAFLAGGTYLRYKGRMLYQQSGQEARFLDMRD